MAFYCRKTSHRTAVSPLGKVSLKHFLLLVLLGMGSLSAAQVLPSTCGPLLGEISTQETHPTSLISKISKLTLKEAKKIVGTARFGENFKLVNKALAYIQKQTYENIDEVIADLEILFFAVSKRGYDWEAAPFRAQDGSIGFIGKDSHILIVRAEGELFKGKIDRRLYTPDRSARLVDYLQLKFIGRVKIQAATAETQARPPSSPSKKEP